jgi:hypothetical protein
LAESREKLLVQLKSIKSRHPTLKILVTEVKEASDSFGIIPDDFDENKLTSVETIRLFSFSKVIDSKTNKIHSLEELQNLLQQPKSSIKRENVFPLKFKP